MFKNEKSKNDIDNIKSNDSLKDFINEGYLSIMIIISIKSYKIYCINNLKISFI